MKRKRNSLKPKRPASSPAKTSRRSAALDRASPRAARRLKPFPIVGIGASAGGFEAFSRLVDNLPDDTGMAIVFVQHLAPGHASALTGLLSSHTKMPVVEVRDRMAIHPNRIYVIPPNVSMTVSRGLLHLVPRVGLQAHMPVDSFLQSLAQERQHQSIGVILSGTATDGTLGLKAIKAAGGLTFAQDERSARYEGMPRSAIASGAVDFVLPPEAIAKELARISRHPALTLFEAAAVEGVSQAEVPDLEKLLALLRARAGADFTYYKPATLRRRIQRRMLVRGVSSLREYVRMLQTSQTECEALYEDILIHVTSFFRDPPTFEVLKRAVFPALIKDRSPNEPIRIWVPGCSTGEDAYSIIIALLEFLKINPAYSRYRIQAFATDISEKAVVTARRGVYPDAIASQVSAARLKRFFSKTERGYQISKAIRDTIVFAKHDVTRDPPYSRLDIVSCRNLLIFLEPVLQHRVLGAFHYALKPHGYLVLGSSETVGERSTYFAAVDRKRKIYSKQPGPAAPVVDLALRQPLPVELPAARAAANNHPLEFDLAREVDRMVIDNYGPPGVLVNEDMEVSQFRGHTGPFLGPTPGAATLNLLKIAHRDLVFELRAGLQKARKSKTAVVRSDIPVKRNGQTRRVNLRIIPVKSPAVARPHYLVLFEAPGPVVEEEASPGPGPVAKLKPVARDVRRLERELDAAKEFARSAVEDQEAANEELRATNEELLSTNEELQTTNEELETAKEELESANEELTTLNDELQNRNQELAQVGSDLRNILSTVYDGTVFVDPDLRVRFFTSPAQKTLNLLPSDVGRPIGDIKPAIDVPDLDRMIADVIEGGPAKETEVSTGDGHWFSLRVRPYLNDRNKIEGAVVSLADVTEARHAREVLAESERRLNFILESSPLVVFVKDAEGRYRYVNPPFEAFADLPRDRILGKTDVEIFPAALAESLRAHDGEIFESAAPVAFEETIPRADGPHTNIVSKFPLRDREGKLYALCGIVTDITQRTRAEQALESANAELQQKALLVDLAHNPIIVRGLDGTISLWNSGAEKAYGWSKDEALARFIREGTERHEFSASVRLTRVLSGRG